MALRFCGEPSAGRVAKLDTFDHYMRRAVKILACVVLGVVVVVVGAIEIMEFQTSRSESQVQRIVSQIPPDTLFSSVVQQLGRPIQSYTNAADVQAFGIIKDPSFIKNCALHMFTHHGPPMRWIL